MIARISPTDLIARRDELDRLHRALDEAGGGRGVVAAITGPIACGKTEFLDATAAMNSFVTLRAMCSMEERTFQYGMLGQLLDHPELMALSSELVRMPASCTGLSVDADNHLRTEFTRTVLALAAEQPVLIGVDDVHHADAQSLLCLLHLARRIGRARVAIVLTELRRPTPAHSRFQAELLSLRHYQEIALRPLTEAQTHEFARRHLGRDTHDDVLTEVFQVTGGNLLLCRGLIDDIQEARSAGRPEAAAGRAYRLAYLGSLYRCGPMALRVARASAVLGARAEHGLVQKMTGLDQEALERVYEQMAEGRLLREGRFPHPAARSVVLDDLSAVERRGLHASALDLLRSHRVSSKILAHHQMGTGRVHGAEVVGLFTDAAREHHIAGELDKAAEYLEFACRASGDPAVHAALRADAAAIERLCNPAKSGRHLPGLLTASREGLLSSEQAVSLVCWLAMDGRPGEAAEVLAAQRAADRSDQDRAQLRVADVSLALLYPGVAVPPGPADPLTPDELASFPSAVRQRGVAENALRSALYGRPGQAEAEADYVLEHARATMDRTTLAMALLALLYTENTAAVQCWVDKLDGDEGMWTPADEAVRAGLGAEVALRRGDLAKAVECGEAALEHRLVPTLGVAAALPLSSTVAAAVRLGDLDRAERWIAEPLPEETTESLFGPHLLWARGQLHLARGRYRSAYLAFRECGERMRRGFVDVQGLALWRVDAAEAILLLGRDREEGMRLISEQLDQPLPPRARAMTLRVQAAYSPPAKGIELLDEAAELLTTAHDQYELARVLADSGDACGALRRHSRARGLFRRARHLAARCGAVPLLRRLGVDSPDVGTTEDATLAQRITSLTEAERRVASRAVVGRTNKEIASQLFVTASTVEQHLTNVFRKLGVKGRQQLPEELADVG
ncbi:LuxR C-terminal-related transcriptional regulator [Streptomyces cucumeris]|uniref:LuxR C-terminal-related transcriptional regulator n=1 Tax=Streptomyces cucumeris TaxID=2962890 RepID=UPI003D70AE86